MKSTTVECLALAVCKPSVTTHWEMTLAVDVYFAGGHSYSRSPPGPAQLNSDPTSLQPCALFAEGKLGGLGFITLLKFSPQAFLAMLRL